MELGDSWFVKIESIPFTGEKTFTLKISWTLFREFKCVAENDRETVGNVWLQECNEIQDTWLCFWFSPSINEVFAFGINFPVHSKNN